MSDRAEGLTNENKIDELCITMVIISSIFHSTTSKLFLYGRLTVKCNTNDTSFEYMFIYVSMEVTWPSPKKQKFTSTFYVYRSNEMYTSQIPNACQTTSTYSQKIKATPMFSLYVKVFSAISKGES